MRSAVAHPEPWSLDLRASCGSPNLNLPGSWYDVAKDTGKPPCDAPACTLPERQTGRHAWLMERPRVLLVDDHAGWRDVARRMLEPRFDVVGEAADGAAALGW